MALKMAISKNQKDPKKTIQKRVIYFLNCSCCGVLIRPDWYSQIDKRYCADCF